MKDFFSTSKMTKSIKGKFTVLNLRNFKTRNIFKVGNNFSRSFRRCRIGICNNPKLSFLKGGGGCESSIGRDPKPDISFHPNYLSQILGSKTTFLFVLFEISIEKGGKRAILT